MTCKVLGLQPALHADSLEWSDANPSDEVEVTNPEDITTMEIITVIAIALGPFLAIWAHGFIERARAANDRRLGVFKTLWATRAAVLSEAHVAALNQIDLEFTRPRDKLVRDAWTVYFDHLSNRLDPPAIPEAGASRRERDGYEKEYQTYSAESKQWNEASRRHLVNLLMEMGKLFGYDFDRVRVDKAAYRPQAIASIEEHQNAILIGLNSLLSGRTSLQMVVSNWPEQSDEQQDALRKIITAIDEKGCYRVRIVEDDDRELIEEIPPSDGTSNRPTPEQAT